MRMAWRITLAEERLLPLTSQSCSLMGIVPPLLTAFIESYKRHMLYDWPRLSLPIWFAESSVNHKLPSGPCVISTGKPPDVGMGKPVITPAVVTRIISSGGDPSV